MQESGRKLLEDTIAWSNWARNEINSIEGLYCLGSDRIGKYGIADLDPTRITINFSAAGISGTKAEAILRKNFKIQVEMADLYNIVALTTIGNRQRDYERLVDALRSIVSTQGSGKTRSKTTGAYPKPPELSILPWEAVYCEKEQVAAADSIGRVCGEMIIPYPPGIPVLMPGEMITREAYEYLKLCVQQGIKINGAADAKLENVWVVKIRHETRDTRPES
jgi:arginine/lysine/ornithine decarboxylase